MTPQDRDELIKAIAAEIRTSAPVLSDDELVWVRMAIKREAQSIALRQAIIEKSLSSLVWSGVVAIGYLFVQWVAAHGYKP
jgi:hypothetical protein